MYDFKSFQFGSGSHETRDEGMCIMEAVAYVAGEKHTDAPECACPVISRFLRAWNDGLESDAERNKWLAEFVWRLPGTVADEAVEEERQRMCFDWLARVNLPAWLDAAGLVAEATSIRAAEGDESLLAAIEVAEAAVWAATRTVVGDDVDVLTDVWDVFSDDVGDVFRAAAGIAAGIAAWSVVGSAVGAAGWAAGWLAVGSTVGAATRTAARAAVLSVARDSLPTEKLKHSARDLVDRMIRLTETEERALDVNQCLTDAKGV